MGFIEWGGLFGLQFCLDKIVKSINLDLICEKSRAEENINLKHKTH